MSNRQNHTGQSAGLWNPEFAAKMRAYFSHVGQQRFPANSSSQPYSSYSHSSNPTNSPPNRALPESQRQPRKKVYLSGSVDTSPQISPSVPLYGHAQLPQPLQRTQNRYSNASSSNLGSGQTQSPQSAEAISTQSFQQHFTSNTTHSTSNFQNSIQDVYIAIMGITNSGKSTFVSICSQQIASIGHDLRSSQLIHSSHSELAS